jgi:hypothetical protein
VKAFAESEKVSTKSFPKVSLDVSLTYALGVETVLHRDCYKASCNPPRSTRHRARMLDCSCIARVSWRRSMEKISPQHQRSPSTVPLARDQDGNPIELPDGALGWRIRRQTGGRPRLLLDSKKQPMLFPLDYTIADVEDILPPGNYLFDVVDKNGEPLGVTVGFSIGMPRNAESVEPDNENSSPMVVPTTLPSTTSDVRLVLEANVRATQMAFIHNQRTLEIGLRMAETLRDSVQVLASSQADWIKSISSARGFFRNAGQQLAPVEVKQLTVTTGGGDDDDEDDDGVTDDGQDGGDSGDGGDGGNGGNGGDDDNRGDGGNGSPSTKQHWSEAWMPVVNHLLVQVMPAVNMWTEKLRADTRDRRVGGTTNDVVDVAGTQASADEQAAAQAERARAEQLAAAVAAASSPARGVDVMKLLQLLPRETSAKLMRIQAALSLDEQADAMQLLKGYLAEDLQDLLTTFDAASLDECIDFLRRLVGDWRKMQAARSARATEPAPADGVGDADAIGNAADPRAAYAASVETLRAAQAEQERAATEHTAQLASAVAAASSPGPGINVFRLLRLLPSHSATRLMHINAALSPDEQADAMQVLKSYSVEGMQELLSAFDGSSVDECAAYLRRVIADWRAFQAAQLTRAKEPPPDGSNSGGMSGAAGPSVAVGSIGTSGAAADPSNSRSAADPSGATGSSGTSGTAGSSGAAGSSDATGSSDAVASSSAVGPSSALAPSGTSSAAGRGGSGSGSKKTR